MIILYTLLICLLADALCWLAAALWKGYRPASAPMLAWPFIWFKRLALKPRGRWM